MRVTALMILVLFFPLPAMADDYPRLRGIDILHYRIAIEIPREGAEIWGETRILFDVRGESVTALPLDLIGMIVDSVAVNGRRVESRHAHGRLTVPLSPQSHAGDRAVASVWYHGSPRDGLYIRRNKHGERTAFADNWPNRARYWFPSVDHPSDKATVDFWIRHPIETQAIANGTFRGMRVVEGDMKITRWSESVASPTYVMVIGVADFAVVEQADTCIPLSYWLFPQDREAGVEQFSRAGEVLRLFSDWFGPYPYEKLALVQSSTRFGGMENSSAIFFAEDPIGTETSVEETVVHEIAHQWFGDSVTEADWHHLWLSEGFASYLTALFYEETAGRKRFREIMDQYRKQVLEYEGEVGPRPIIDPSITNLFDLLNSNVYEKGAWVLHMLRGLVGDDAFFRGLRDYYLTFREGTALTEDFRRVMEAASGQDLDWFFDQWVFRGGHPQLGVSWTWRDGELALTIRQRTDRQVFRLPLEVEINWRGGGKRESVWIDEAVETLSFSVPEEPGAVRLDPEGWILKTVLPPSG